MSYCRWSSMNWMCDVYVYEGEGWTIHVASRRRAFPPVPDYFERWSAAFSRWSGAEWDAETSKVVYKSRWRERAANVFYRLWAFWHNEVHLRSLALIPLWPIGLPMDGQTFDTLTPDACADMLEVLRHNGYRVPQYAINRLRKEAKEVGK